MGATAVADAGAGADEAARGASSRSGLGRSGSGPTGLTLGLTVGLTLESTAGDGPGLVAGWLAGPRAGRGPDPVWAVPSNGATASKRLRSSEMIRVYDI